MGVCSEGVRRGEVRLVTVHEEMCEARENILKIAKIKKNCQLGTYSSTRQPSKTVTIRRAAAVQLARREITSPHTLELELDDDPRNTAKPQPSNRTDLLLCLH